MSIAVSLYLESSGTPVDELDGSLRLDGGDGGIDILGNDIAAVEHATRHVLAVARIALDHLISRLETSLRRLEND